MFLEARGSIINGSNFKCHDKAGIVSRIAQLQSEKDQPKIEAE